MAHQSIFILKEICLICHTYEVKNLGVFGVEAESIPKFTSPKILFQLSNL